MAELMTKIFDPKSISFESMGSHSCLGHINREQIINAIAIAGQNAPQGLDALMVKMRNDRNALDRLVAAIPGWLNTRQLSLPENALTVCFIAVQIATGKPIISQVPKLKSLLKRYSSRGKRCSSNVRKYQALIRRADRAMLTATQHKYEQLKAYIHSLDDAIKREKRALDIWAMQAATESNLCPHCQGTGVLGSTSCQSCQGVGIAIATTNDVYKSLRKLGLVSGQREFTSVHWPLICQCITWLLAEMGECQHIFYDVIGNECS